MFEMFNMVYWNWWTLAALFLIIEIIAPGVYFLWLAIAATLVGFSVLLLADLGLIWQLLLFGVLSLVSVILWLSWQKKHPVITDEPLLNNRLQRYVGRQATVVEAIINGEGKVQIGDTRWQVTGVDCPISSTVKIIAVVKNSTVLTVELIHKADG